MADVSDTAPRNGEDRVIVRYCPGGPIDLIGLSDSLAALARIYERHYQKEADDASPRLYITKLKSGSIIAEIAPFVMMFGQPAYAAMASSVVVANFAKRLSDGIKGFAGIDSKVPPPSTDDAADLREFVKPLTGRRGASLGIRHAKFTKKDKDHEVVAEYTFSEEEINRAALNIDNLVSLPSTIPVTDDCSLLESQRIHKEVMLFFHQASRAAGKEEGRTADKAVVPDISDKPLPVYFRKGVNDLKNQMVKGEPNPLTNAFIVDIHVQSVSGQPKAYVVTDVHKIIPLGDD